MLDCLRAHGLASGEIVAPGRRDLRTPTKKGESYFGYSKEARNEKSGCKGHRQQVGFDRQQAAGVNYEKSRVRRKLRKQDEKEQLTTVNKRIRNRKKPAASAASTIGDPAADAANPESGATVPSEAGGHAGSANRPGGQAAAQHSTGGESRTRSRSRSRSSGGSSSQKRGRGRPPLTAGSARRPGATAAAMPEVSRADLAGSIMIGTDNALGLPAFHFRASAWNGIEPLEDYETRVLSRCQDAFVAYAKYCKVVASANGTQTY